MAANPVTKEDEAVRPLASVLHPATTFDGGFTLIEGFDAKQEIEDLRDHLALIAVHTGSTSRDLLVKLCLMYGLEHVERRAPR